MIQRIALYSTMGLLLQALGHTWDTWQFWSMLALFWASESVSKREQHEQSYVQGILMYIALEPQQQQELAQAIQQVVEDKHND
jgi:hypothetical protein